MCVVKIFAHCLSQAMKATSPQLRPVNLETVRSCAFDQRGNFALLQVVFDELI